MDRVILTWNGANWLTVVLMATVGFVVLGLLTQAFKAVRRGGESNG